MTKTEAEAADQVRDIIENPEEFWRRLEAEIKSWPKCPPEPDIELPPPLL